MSQRKRQLLFAILVVSGFGLAACYGSSSNGTASNAASSSRSSSTGSSSSGTAVGLIPLVTGDNKLELLDPSQAIGNGNPVIADTDLPNHHFLDSAQISASTGYDPSHPPHDMIQFISFQTGTINSGTGALSNIHTARAVYIKGSPGAGKLFTVDTVRGDSHAPVQVSHIGNACGINVGSSLKLDDFSNPIDSWILVGLPGKDGTCFTRDDQYVAVKLNTPATRPGVTAAGLRSALALHDSSGAIAGFLDNVANADGTETYEHRDANFANPTTVFTSASGEEPRVEDLSTTQIYFAFVPSGQSIYELHRYNVVSGRLSAALYTFAHGDPSLLFNANPADANNYYFTDGNKVLRIPRSATAAGEAVLMTTLPSDPQYVTLQHLVTSNRIFGQTLEKKYGTGGSVFSVPIDASNATATTLASNASRATYELHTVGPSGLVYINKITAASSGLTYNAILVHDDGTGMSSTANATWVGYFYSPNDDIKIGFLSARPTMVLLDTLSNLSSNFTRTHTLAAINASTGKLQKPLGSIAKVLDLGIYGFGYGQYAQVRVGMDKAYVTNIYIADFQAANSLKPVSTIKGSNSYVIQGY